MARDFARQINLINDTLRQELTRAQASYEEFANRNREHAPRF